MGKMSEAIETLAGQIGDRFYLDIAKWHLYLKDAKLHQNLAERLYALVEEDRINEEAITEILQETKIKVGGGRSLLPLQQFLPVGTETDLLETLTTFKEDYL